jgi:hypothetical protein
MVVDNAQPENTELLSESDHDEMIVNPVVPEIAQSKSREGTQIFRTQKISGLAILNQMATDQMLGGEADDIKEGDETGLNEYLIGLDKESKDDSDEGKVMSDLKDANESQEEGFESEKKVMNDFLQKFEAQASKKTGLLI